MLGHLKPKLCGTNPQHKAQYQEMYCSICASIRNENHVAYTFLLSHELTLVMLAMREYLPDAQQIRTSCPAKAFLATQKAQKHPALALAGKFSIVLGWVKVTDWATDHPRFYKTWVKNTLQRKVNRILPNLPTQTQDIIAHYLWLTKTNSTDFEEVVRYSGLLSETLVTSIGLHTNLPADQLTQLASLFRLNGELIATADHLIDAEKDLAQDQYNPVFYQAQQENISWKEAYQQVLTQYNRLKIQIEASIQTLQKEGIASPSFVAMLYRALQNLQKSVEKNKPYFVEYGETNTITSQKLAYHKANCSCDGCDCGDCSCCEACDVCSCGGTGSSNSHVMPVKKNDEEKPI